MVNNKEDISHNLNINKDMGNKEECNSKDTNNTLNNNNNME